MILRFEIQSEQYSDRWGDSVRVLQRLTERALVSVIQTRYAFIRWNERLSADTLILRVSAPDARKQSFQALEGVLAGPHSPKPTVVFAFTEPFERFAVTARNRNLQLPELVEEWARRAGEVLDGEHKSFVADVLGKLPIQTPFEIDAPNATATLRLRLNPFTSIGQRELRFRANVVLRHPRDRTTGEADLQLAQCLPTPRGSQCRIISVFYTDTSFEGDEMKKLLGDHRIEKRTLHLLAYKPPLRSAGTVAIR